MVYRSLGWDQSEVSMGVEPVGMEGVLLTDVEDREDQPPGGSMTEHIIDKADARDLSFVEDESVHLIVTSPPYFDIKTYAEKEGQLGIDQSYKAFISDLTLAWIECERVLVKGGRLCCVVGDVLRSRKKYGRHYSLPLHADIVVSCRSLGFDYLTSIIWNKITNWTAEAPGSKGMLGQPYQPNGSIKNEVEYILMLRKPGAYRHLPPGQRKRSAISKEDYRKWFVPIWRVNGAPTMKGHPAPFPIEIPRRLIRMFSYVDDTVLDPFLGSGTTCLAALEAGRNSIGTDISEEYVSKAISRMNHAINIKHEINSFSCLSTSRPP